MTTKQFLDRQEALAKQRLQFSLHHAGRELEQAMNLADLVRRHPVLTLGAGAGGGLLLGRQLAHAWSGASGGFVRRAGGWLARPVLFALRSALLATLFSETVEGERP